MNWGGKPYSHAQGEAEGEPWAPLFSHPENYSRGFQSPLLTWFSLWGHPLSHHAPTFLDGAIAQSNVFFDQSPRFLQKPERERWIIGVERLAEAIKVHDFAGILIVSTTVADWIVWLSARGDIPAWCKTMGNLQWGSAMHNRLKLRFGRNGHRLLAAVAHPSSGVAHADVENSKVEMSPWIQSVLTEYRKKTEPEN